MVQPQANPQPQPDHELQLIQQARDLLIQALEAHEKVCSNPHCRERANFLAFIAHSLGVSREDLRAFPWLFVGYEIRCKKHGGCDIHKSGGSKP